MQMSRQQPPDDSEAPKYPTPTTEIDGDRPASELAPDHSLHSHPFIAMPWRPSCHRWSGVRSSDPTLCNRPPRCQNRRRLLHAASSRYCFALLSPSLQIASDLASSMILTILSSGRDSLLRIISRRQLPTHVPARHDSAPCI
ncbi:hypothetical protein BOTBODRAFT_299414 [Botryobasidium botryosum FD-172 SS1]|uniref:Uncharacterized protein n=1 Tax=Botryobasidium botryosum (strain FD-172 SS1) TaxID=930990 RepID=A0A067LU32_BOTB1|nr:hypothetical protein BOTBODRAFT_299414 [Botryobasidium botryosum FD-172 SS1]